MSIRMYAALLSAALLCGCAATINQPEAQLSAPSMRIPAESTRRVVLNLQLAASHPQDEGWQAFKQEWIAIAREQALAKGLVFSEQDGEPKPSGEAGTLLVVRVLDYRYVGIGRRLMLGVMSGNAFVDAKVEFRDLTTGTLYGERAYNTSSSAWHGVAAAMTPKQLYAIADATLAELGRR